MTENQEVELRTLARETYIKTRINRSHMPDPDTDDGQRRIDRLFDIMAQAFRESKLDLAAVSNGHRENPQGEQI